MQYDPVQYDIRANLQDILQIDACSQEVTEPQEVSYQCFNVEPSWAEEHCSFVPGIEMFLREFTSSVVSAAITSKTEAEKGTSTSNTISKPEDKSQVAITAHGVSTNIKDFLAKQKEMAKRKPSKTPEKKKNNKIQKTKKRNLTKKHY